MVFNSIAELATKERRKQKLKDRRAKVLGTPKSMVEKKEALKLEGKHRDLSKFGFKIKLKKKDDR